MPEVEANRTNWTRDWEWSQQGDEWSAWWGGTDAMWNAAIFPRIHPWVPAGTILEIAPGFGRWTQYLAALASERVIAVDLTERCVAHCRERFASDPSVEVHRNDGRSLPMVADASVDFAFSFDSLVHAESDVIGAYVSELARVLKPDGVAFVHHSNIGAYPRQTALARRVRGRLNAPLMRRGLLINMAAWRAESVTAESVADQAATAGLACIAQEKVNWEFGRQLIDAFTVVTPRGSRRERPRVVVDNPRFADEAARVRRLYSA